MSGQRRISQPQTLYTDRSKADLNRRSTAVGLCFVTLAIFIIVFPKGGIKLSGVPLTWGYILIAVMASLSLITLSAPPKRCVQALGLSLPFILLVLPLGFASTFGVSGRGLGFIFSAVLSFVIFPFIFLGIFSGKVRKIPPSIFSKCMVWSVRFIALYGIILFAYKIMVGTFFEIPFLTVNAGDVGGLSSKPITRAGGIAKLISTYNNGNIYGVCLPMILPVYLLFERNPLFVAIVWTSQFLTISRTAWAGGIFLIFVLYYLGNRISVNRLLRGLFVTIIGFLLVAWLLQLLGRDLSWVFDPSMNGRVDKYDGIVNSLNIFPTGSVTGFGEIVYLGILDDYGLIGFIFFIPFFFGGLILSYLGKYAHHPIRRAARQGLMAYLFMSMSDAAILFIPVMAFFYFTILLALEGHHLIPAHDPDAVRLLK